MQGITPDPAGSWGRAHTLFIMCIYIVDATLIMLIGTRINLFCV